MRFGGKLLRRALVRFALVAALVVLSAASAGVVVAAPGSSPVASFTATPNPAKTGETVFFNAEASTDRQGPIAKYEWDLDGNGTFETNTGTSATTSRAYAVDGVVNVKLRVTDQQGLTSEDTESVTITNRVPTASFTVNPNSAFTGQEVTFTSTSRDPDGSIARHEWDLDGNGSFETNSGPDRTVSRRYAASGYVDVQLRVTDDDGATSAPASRQVAIFDPPPAANPPPAAKVFYPLPPPQTVSPPPQTVSPPLQTVSPFPIVRIVGRLVRGGAQIRRLSVRAPADTIITVRCRGRRCPYRRASTAARAGRSVRFRRLERRLRAGTLVEILVSHPTKIGKYTGFRIRRGRSPRRKDLCLAPGARRGSECPSG
ncbi:MAG: PKD domain-containing protein [Thermoleophilaceae bacterium]|nr:PKD domain-containing protein [Thermoleophilaceae bacterium]